MKHLALLLTGMYQLMRLVLLISLLPALLFAQQRQNMTYDIVLFKKEHRSGHFQNIDTLDVLTYQAWNPARTIGTKLIILTRLPQGFGARALVFVRDDTVITEPDTIKYARFFRGGKKQVRQDFTMIRVDAESYNRFDSKGKLVRRELVSDPELVFKDARFRKNNKVIKDRVKLVRKVKAKK